MLVKQVCDRGKSGFDGGIRGSMGWDGAIILHFRHCALVCRMLASNPGQNNRCRALAIISLKPWCAECSASRTSARSCLDIRIFSFMGTSSRQYNWSAIDQNCRIFNVSPWHDLGNLFCMYSANARHSSSVAAAATILTAAPCIGDLLELTSRARYPVFMPFP